MKGTGDVISGIGQSAIGRRLGRSALDLAVDACLVAVADAGLQLADIDGLATFPGLVPRPPGYSEVGAHELMTALGLRLNWYAGAAETSAQMGSVINAVAAVRAGMARHVLCFRVVTEGSRRRSAGGPSAGSAEAVGVRQWTQTYGRSAANWLGVLAQRHMHQYGTTREQLAQVALSDRANAALNPAAVYRESLTLEDYLSARMISTPLCLYDCDVPVDGATALVVSAAECLQDLGPRVVTIESFGAAITGPYSYDQFEDFASRPSHHAAAAMWATTEFGPDDVDVACIYDGISWLALDWLEALAFCKQGESGSFVEDGRLALDGALPFNPNGGQLSGGRLHGYGFIHEACVQLRGEGGIRQVPNRPKVAVVTNGGGPLASAMLLRTG